MENSAHFDMLLGQVVNTFSHNASLLLMNKLNISILDNVKMSNKDSIWSVCKYSRVSDSMMEMMPLKSISIKVMCAVLYSYKLDLNMEQGDKVVSLSLPSVTVQSSKMSLCELASLFESSKINLSKLSSEAMSKVKFLKYICDDKSLQFLKHIDSGMTSALALLSEMYSQNKNSLSS